MAKFSVITLCGSTRFKDTFHEVAEMLTSQGHIVLMPHCYSSADNKPLDAEKKQMLVDMHRQMIDMSDSIFVIDVDSYVGEDTQSEIEYAWNKGKPVFRYSYIPNKEDVIR